MTARAVLLTSSGAVHRVIVGSDGADQTACGRPLTRAALVSPVQALVWHVPPCSDCWEARGSGNTSSRG